jgi:D-alanyl-D-alanine carboxypeptidase
LLSSITKTFTATAVLQLVEEGKLSKSDALSKWYPDFSNAEKITVEHLLRMRSGIVDSFDEQWWEAYENNSLGDVSAEDMIERSASRGGRFVTPGKRTVYTNVNYVILGDIVEKVSGKDIGTRITQTILKPLRLENTIYPTNNDLPGDLHGYSWDISTGKLTDMTNLDPTPGGAAGTMLSNIWDLKTWAEAVCTGKLLKPETQRARLQTQPFEGAPPFIGYGEGIVKIGSLCGHGGGVFGFSSVMWYLPQKDATIVVSVNRFEESLGESPADLLAHDIMQILVPKDVV